MDLSTIRGRIQRHRYAAASEFEADVKQILENAKLVYGDSHSVTVAAVNVNAEANNQLHSVSDQNCLLL